jgi:hypothetical protein
MASRSGKYTALRFTSRLERATLIRARIPLGWVRIGGQEAERRTAAAEGGAGGVSGYADGVRGRQISVNALQSRDAILVQHRQRPQVLAMGRWKE